MLTLFELNKVQNLWVSKTRLYSWPGLFRNACSTLVKISFCKIVPVLITILIVYTVCSELYTCHVADNERIKNKKKKISIFTIKCLMFNAAVCETCWYLSSQGPYKDTHSLQSFWTRAKCSQPGKGNSENSQADSIQLTFTTLHN